MLELGVKANCEDVLISETCIVMLLLDVKYS